jgi:PAS domain S-box-containing protein
VLAESSMEGAKNPTSRMDDALRAILNGLPALIGYWDANLRNKLANQAYVDYFGLTPEQMLGLHISEVLGPTLYEKNLPFLERALAGERQMFDREIETPSGEKRYTQASYIPDVVDGEVRGIFVLVTDISQRRIAELDAEKSRLAAQAADRAKTDFLARVSHEFRTPLVSILGFVNLMRGDGLSPEALDDLDHIERGARQLAALVDDLLDSASLAAGRLSVHPTGVCVAGVLRDAMALVRPLADERNVELALAPSADLDEIAVWADPDRLKQIALNLLSNAIKYGPRHERVVVSVEVADGVASLRFADNGAPLSPEDSAKIFEPMVRLGGSDETGTGLGLPLSRSLAEAMGGTLTVVPGAEAGNTFVVTLATWEGPLESAEEVSAGRKQPTRALRLRTNLRRLLYVESHADSLGLVSAMLARFADVEVIPASHGNMAIDLARIVAPDAILLDVDLPDIGGAELARLLRSDERTRNVPIIAMGAAIDDALKADLAAAGVTVLLAKPFAIEDLFDALVQIAETD